MDLPNNLMIYVVRLAVVVVAVVVVSFWLLYSCFIMFIALIAFLSVSLSPNPNLPGARE